MINLVNHGIPVWITTHSDTILQHINNMIKLNTNKHCSKLMEEYGYQKDDLLSGKDVSMYQFVESESGRSKLEKLECTQYGFVIPTFNDALEQIVGEVYAFQEE